MEKSNYNPAAAEEEIVTAVIDAALAAGYSLSWDLWEEGKFFPQVPSKGRAELLKFWVEPEYEFAHDYLFLWDMSGDTARANSEWVKLVRGNGCDVVSDYSSVAKLDQLFGEASVVWAISERYQEHGERRRAWMPNRRASLYGNRFKPKRTWGRRVTDYQRLQTGE